VVCRVSDRCCVLTSVCVKALRLIYTNSIQWFVQSRLCTFSRSLCAPLLLSTSWAGGRHNMPRLLWPWPLTFWPGKWCPSHVWRGLPLWQFYSSYRPLCSRLRPDVCDRPTDIRQTDVKRQHHRLMPLPMGRVHKKRYNWIPAKAVKTLARCLTALTDVMLTVLAAWYRS